MQYHLRTQSIWCNRPFGPYALAGISIFSLELFLLWILIDVFKVPYLIATGPLFILGISAHYLATHRFSFPHAPTTRMRAYIRFIMFASGGALLVTALMRILIETFDTEPTFARGAIAAVVGVVMYFIHKRFTFLGGGAPQSAE